MQIWQIIFFLESIIFISAIYWKSIIEKPNFIFNQLLAIEQERGFGKSQQITFNYSQPKIDALGQNSHQGEEEPTLETADKPSEEEIMSQAEFAKSEISRIISSSSQLEMPVEKDMSIREYLKQYKERQMSHIEQYVKHDDLQDNANDSNQENIGNFI